MAPFRILALDGGGIRGVLTATLLERMATAQPDFLEKTDLIAGTSTGGILALGLASGMTPTQARELYENLGARVFKDSFWDNLKDLGQLKGAQYSNKPLREELEKHFGSMKLSELKKRVVISSFDLDNEETRIGKPRMWKAKYFHNFPGVDSDGHEKVVDVALRTSAAPTFFPMVQGYIDGGVISNNPSLCALAQALEPNTGKQKLSDIRLISVGTGHNPKYIDEQDEDWGLVQWAPYLISIMMDGSSNLAHYQCTQLLNRHYIRVNPVLPMDISLDSLDQVPLLKTLAAEYDLENAREWVKAYYKYKVKVA